MDTLTICRLACGDLNIKRHFGGVFASDDLPERKKKFISFVVNIDPKRLPGSHWIGIFFKQNTALYFDSYGRPPTNKNILKFLKRNSKKICYNNVCFQDYFSNSCGYFCLYFLWVSSRNLPMQGMSELDQKGNEAFIKRFANHNLKPSNCCASFLARGQQNCHALLNVVGHTIKV